MFIFYMFYIFQIVLFLHNSQGKVNKTLNKHAVSLIKKTFFFFLLFQVVLTHVYFRKLSQQQHPELFFFILGNFENRCVYGMNSQTK